MILQERHFLAFFATIIAIVVPIFAITMGLPALALLPILLFLGYGLISNANRMYIFALICVAVQLKAPIGRFMMADICYLLVVALLLLKISIHKTEKQSSNLMCDRLVIFFLVNMLIIIFFRGAGLAILGDTKVGGGSYILWIACLLGLFFSKYIKLNSKEAKFLILGWMILPLLNPFLEWLTIKSGGSIYPITKYFNIKFGTLYQAIVIQDIETIRAGTGPISVFFQIVSLLILARRQNLFLFAVFAVLGGIAIMFSGFRSYLVAYFVVTFISAYFLYKKRAALVTFALVSSVSLYLVFLIIIDYVSFAVQRALSFVPGLKVDGIALENALDTTTWRIEIWELALKDFWTYAFVGRGLAWEIQGWTNLFHGNWYQTPTFFYANHNYHSGPVTVLIDYGLPGTILWLGLQILAIKDLGKYFKLAVKNASKSIICSFYVYGYILVFWDVIHFWLIYGQTATMQKFISYFILMKLLQVVIKNDFSDDNINLNKNIFESSKPIKVS